MTAFEDITATRSRWAVALATLPRERIMALAATFARQYQATPTAVPRSGLALLTLKDSVKGQTFYLGEIPVSSSQVLLTDAERTVEGGALLMADDADLVGALAICDGVLANRLAGWEMVAREVRSGIANLDKEARIRKTMATRSRVHFSLLNEEDNDDAA